MAEKIDIKQNFLDFVDFIKAEASKLTNNLPVKENISEPLGEMANIPAADAREVIARKEMLAKIISSLLGIAASFGLTYFAVKWMTNAMDPTRKEKQKARESVCSFLLSLNGRPINEACLVYKFDCTAFFGLVTLSCRGRFKGVRANLNQFISFSWGNLVIIYNITKKKPLKLVWP